MGRARRRPRVRVIVNTGNGRPSKPGLDVGQLAQDQRGAARAVPRTRRRAAVHRLAQRRLEARDRRCQRRVRRWRLHFVADADIVIASPTPPSSTPTCRSARSRPTRPSLAEVADGGDHAHGAHWCHERLSAEQAHQLGILSEVVDPGRLRHRAGEIAELVARNSPAAMAATKRALWGALEPASPRRAARAPPSSSPVGAPDQTEGPRRGPRRGTRSGL